MPGSRLVIGKAMRGGTGPWVVTSGPRKLSVFSRTDIAPNVRLPLSLTKVPVQDCPKNGNENPAGKETGAAMSFFMSRCVAPAGAGGASVLMMIDPTFTV